jgi:hypothetical protein
VAKYYPKLKVVLKNDEIFSQKHFFLKLLASFQKKLASSFFFLFFATFLKI